MNELHNLINQLEAKIQYADLINLDVSSSNVSWHIEHTLLTLRGVSNVLINSNPSDYKWKFNYVRTYVLTFNKIPRGKAKAPDVVNPKVGIDKEALIALLSETRSKVGVAEALPNDKFFKHPFLGNLRRKQTIKFLGIHTRHHLEIINDIIKSSR
ncbi:MAG TPA: hypothetical protein PLG57_04775 [Bacteroidia bacterium]|nr:hypothetical protein [Bacteroidia bacterium]